MSVTTPTESTRCESLYSVDWSNACLEIGIASPTAEWTQLDADDLKIIIRLLTLPTPHGTAAESSTGLRAIHHWALAALAWIEAHPSRMR